MDMDVAQIGGQLRKFPLHIEPGTIPLNQGAGSKSMSHVVKPWTTAVPLS